MEDLTKGDERSIRRGLTELFTFIGQEEGGITARWYHIDRCKKNTLKPGKGSGPFGPFDKPIPPLSQLFRLGEVRTIKVLLACGILDPLKKGKKKGVVGVSLSAWDALRETPNTPLLFPFFNGSKIPHASSTLLARTSPSWKSCDSGGIGLSKRSKGSDPFPGFNVSFLQL